MELRAALWSVLGFGVFPLWLVAGGADWLCHRRTAIERTSGPRESLFHLALFAQIAVPALLGLWFEINALLILIMAAGVVAHFATSWWDTTFAQPRRHIMPVEQLVHSWLEMLPVFALVIVALLHADAIGDPGWRLVPRAEPIPTGWQWAVPLGFAVGLAFNVEEYLRGRRVRGN